MESFISKTHIVLYIFKALCLLLGITFIYSFISCGPGGKQIALQVLCSNGEIDTSIGETSADCGGECEEQFGRNCVEGFADLHAHPATHLAFGGDIIWGDVYNQSNPDLQAPIPSCDEYWHTPGVSNVDPATSLVRFEILKKIHEKSRGFYTHQSNGEPDYSNWPNGLSISHQMMRLDWIKRAWEGGLRLMIATTTDSEGLHEIWHMSAYDVLVDEPDPSPGFDLARAQEQVEFIKEMVQAVDWMTIVGTPSEARQVINDGKLAVILGVEHDRLTMSELEILFNQDVRLVTPIHLTDNMFGGTAVYSDQFNMQNEWLNRSFYDVEENSRVRFRLSSEQQALNSTFNTGFWDQIQAYPDCSKPVSGQSVHVADDILAVAWNSQPNGLIMFSRLENNVWTRSFIPGFSHYPPDITYYNGQWYAVWTDMFGDEPFVHLAKSTDGVVWADHIIFDGTNGNPKIQSGHRPKIITVNDDLYIAWVGSKAQKLFSEYDPYELWSLAPNTGKIRWIKSNDGVNWSEKKIITFNGVPITSFNDPELIERDGEFYIFWTNESGIIRSMRTNGFNANWTNFQLTNPIPLLSDFSPSVINKDDSLILAYKMRQTDQIGWLISPDGNNWIGHSQVRDFRNRQTGFSPSICWYDNQYELYWTGRTHKEELYRLNRMKFMNNRWYGHEPQPGCRGQVNRKGLNYHAREWLRDLMEMGYIVDVAHMSHKSLNDFIEIAEEYNYPILNSHGGISDTLNIANSERDMMDEHVAAMNRIGGGGILGFGTSWNPDHNEPVKTWTTNYLDACERIGTNLAFGTDINGLQEQINKSEIAIEYPFVTAMSNSLDRHRLGSTKVFDIQNDGIAHYGMLPDFIEAASVSNSDAKVRINKSAQSMINVWERIEFNRSLYFD